MQRSTVVMTLLATAGVICAALAWLPVQAQDTQPATPLDKQGAEALAVESAEISDEAWAEIMGPAESEIPAALPDLIWRDDLSEALSEAQESDRPLFVTVRCLPCKQCSGFDATVLDAEGELKTTLLNFVTVRLTNMRTIDARLLPYPTHQDLDVSWWGYFLTPEGGLYGVYGGIDAEGDDTRMSAEGLRTTMQRVLDFHYDDRREGWEATPAAPDLDEGDEQTPPNQDGWESWEERGFKEAKEGECLHCHQVSEILRQPAIDDEDFDKKTDFYVWPYPENIGLHLALDHGLRVERVIEDSPAEDEDVREGDVLRAANGTLLFSASDLRAVLHNLEGRRPKLALKLFRKGEVVDVELRLDKGWRETDLGWRKSVAEADIGAHYGFGWPLQVNAGERKRRKIDDEGMAIKPWWGNKAAWGRAIDAGMKANEFVVAVDGETPEIFGRAFLVWFRLRYEPGDTVEFTLVDPQGKRRTISYEVGEKRGS